MTEGIYKVTIRQPDQSLILLLSDGASRIEVESRLRAEGYEVRQVVEANYKAIPFESEVIYP